MTTYLKGRMFQMILCIILGAVSLYFDLPFLAVIFMALFVACFGYQPKTDKITDIDNPYKL